MGRYIVLLFLKPWILHLIDDQHAKKTRHHTKLNMDYAQLQLIVVLKVRYILLLNVTMRQRHVRLLKNVESKNVLPIKIVVRRGKLILTMGVMGDHVVIFEIAG